MHFYEVNMNCHTSKGIWQNRENRSLRRHQKCGLKGLSTLIKETLYLKTSKPDLTVFLNLIV